MLAPVSANYRLRLPGDSRAVLPAVLSAVLGVAFPVSAVAEIEEVVVVGDLGSLPDEDVQSVFGFGKSLLYTPRSASTVSEEMMARFDMRDIDELIAVAPGSFTQSFFGVAGSLDIRGTPGETYFRGVRRLDNPGNYPTPIGASDRIDIVRGPASPIYGPAKIGGYLNFNPKSARIEATGEFIAATTGAVGLGTGTWNKRIATAEVGGPGGGGRRSGFRLLPLLRARRLGQLLSRQRRRADHAAGFVRRGSDGSSADSVRRHVPRLHG